MGKFGQWTADIAALVLVLGLFIYFVPKDRNDPPIQSVKAATVVAKVYPGALLKATKEIPVVYTYDHLKYSTSPGYLLRVYHCEAQCTVEMYFRPNDQSAHSTVYIDADDLRNGAVNVSP